MGSKNTRGVVGAYLESVDLGDLVSLPECLGRTLGQTDVLDLSFLSELVHRPDGVLDRGLWVHSVLVVYGGQPGL